MLLEQEDPELSQPQAKLSFSVYIKSFYRVVYQEGIKNANKQATLKHMEYLFEALQSTTIALKPKFSLVSAMEQMLTLYHLQETNAKDLH